MKKLLSVLVCVAMLVTMMPGMAWATDESPITPPSDMVASWQCDTYNPAFEATPNQQFFILVKNDGTTPAFEYTIEGVEGKFTVNQSCVNFAVSEPAQTTINEIEYTYVQIGVSGNTQLGKYTFSYGDKSCSIVIKSGDGTDQTETSNDVYASWKNNAFDPVFQLTPKQQFFLMAKTSGTTPQFTYTIKDTQGTFNADASSTDFEVLSSTGTTTIENETYYYVQLRVKDTARPGDYTFSYDGKSYSVTVEQNSGTNQNVPPSEMGAYWNIENYDIVHEATPKQKFVVMLKTEIADLMFTYTISGDESTYNANEQCVDFQVSFPTQVTKGEAKYTCVEFVVRDNARLGEYTFSYGGKSCSITVKSGGGTDQTEPSNDVYASWKNNAFDPVFQLTPKQQFFLMAKTSGATPQFTYTIKDIQGTFNADASSTDFEVLSSTGTTTIENETYYYVQLRVKDTARPGDYTFSYDGKSYSVTVKGGELPSSPVLRISGNGHSVLAGEVITKEIFSTYMTVHYGDECVSPASISVNPADGADVGITSDGKIELVPLKAGTHTLTVEYNGEGYNFSVVVQDNDIGSSPAKLYWKTLGQNETPLNFGTGDGEIEISSDVLTVEQLTVQNGWRDSIECSAGETIQGQLVLAFDSRLVTFTNGFFVTSKQAVVDISNEGNVFTLNFSSGGNAFIQTGDSQFKIPVTSIIELVGEVSDKPFDFYTEANGQYELMVNEGQYSYVQPNMFFTYENNPDTFFIIKEGSGNPVLTIRNRQGEEISGITVVKEEATYRYSGKKYIVYKVTVDNPQTFGAQRMYVKFSDNSYERELWIAGDEYIRANDEFESWGFRLLMRSLPENGWATIDDVESSPEKINTPSYYLNMSEPASSDVNSFYIVHEPGTTVSINQLTQYLAYVDGTQLSSGDRGKFEKLLPTSGDNCPMLLTQVKDGIENAITIEGDAFAATKVTLKNYLGHENLRVKFNINNWDGTVNATHQIELCMGMDIRIKATDEGVDALAGLKHIKDGHNALMEALGFAPVTDGFKFVKNSDGSYSAFFDKALATFSEEGQGYQCGLDIQLNPGYVINNITSKNGTPYNFSIENRYYYDVTDKNGLKRDNFQLRSETGWMAGIGNRGKENYMVQHVLASYGTLEEFRTAGFETVTAFNAFLDGTAKNEENPWGETFRNDLAPYTAELTGTYTDYTFDFAKELRTSQNEIVIEISKAEFGENVGTSGGNANVEIVVGDKVFTEEDLKDGEVLLHKLYSNGNTDWYIAKAYEITEKDGDGVFNGFVNITIPRSEFKGNNENFEVYYFTKDGVPVKLETAYTENGLVFMTGHFSTYAIVSTGAKASDDNSGSTDIYIPVTPPAPSTPKDEVTNQAGTTTTAPSTNADLSQSTTIKGNETTTTVDQTIADKIVESAVSNKSEEVVIDATVKTEAADHSTKSATVEVPTETIAQIAEKTEAAVTIKTDVAEIKLDTEALAAVADQAEGKSVSVVAETVKADAKEIRVELKIVCSEGKTISDFKGGNISVTVEAPKGKKDVVCVYIDEQGHWHTVPGQLNADGTYTFTTGHFSTYAIVDAEHAADTIAAQKEAVKAVQLKIRSANAKTSKGKKAIKLTISEVTKTGIDFDGYVIYRSTKKTSGFKKIYTTKTGTYFNTSAKKGVKYYYKAKGFVTIDGEKVYTGWSKKAIRTAK